mmetsp:Transcript_40360/g.115967  ORF Transcript_40360/g.115967 Transcript_40360/m.115967 type:complete len:237 (+) Transcript_40360:2297-3007(+)
MGKRCMMERSQVASRGATRPRTPVASSTHKKSFRTSATAATTSEPFLRLFHLTSAFSYFCGSKPSFIKEGRQVSSRCDKGGPLRKFSVFATRMILASQTALSLRASKGIGASFALQLLGRSFRSTICAACRWPRTLFGALSVALAPLTETHRILTGAPTSCFSTTVDFSASGRRSAMKRCLSLSTFFMSTRTVWPAVSSSLGFSTKWAAICPFGARPDTPQLPTLTSAPKSRRSLT